MTVFYDRLNRLCKENGTNITAVSRQYLGVTSSTPTGWRRGVHPRADVVIRAARHFHVSADYLLGLSDAPQPLQQTQLRSESSFLDQLEEQPPEVRAIVLAVAKATLRALTEAGGEGRPADE